MSNNLNTVKIGDDFELKSLSILMKVIEEGQLGYLPEYLKVFQKKGYYSHLRKKDIIFDLTIEVWPPGANRYVLIYIIECKNYAKRVPVNKIEDFHDKIRQIGGVNIKAIFIINSPLQEAGFNIAESIGMMVIQGESVDDYKIILHKTNRDTTIGKIPLLKETINSKLIDTGVEHITKLLDKEIIDIFKPVDNSLRISYNIDKLSKEDIEALANNELDKIDYKILIEAHTIDSNMLAEYMRNEYGVEVTGIASNSHLLGTCDIEHNVIGINNVIQGTNRELFILAHEFGHYVLHQKLFIGQTQYESFEDSEYNFRTGKHDLNNPKHWIEWQANYFASSLVLPKPPFLARVWKCQDYLNRPRGKVYLDDQYDNRKDFNELVKRLAYNFNVSKTSVIYKLKEMELINDKSRLKSLRQIIHEYRDELCI